MLATNTLLHCWVGWRDGDSKAKYDPDIQFTHSSYVWWICIIYIYNLKNKQLENCVCVGWHNMWNLGNRHNVIHSISTGWAGRRDLWTTTRSSNYSPVNYHSNLTEDVYIFRLFETRYQHSSQPSSYVFKNQCVVASETNNPSQTNGWNLKITPHWKGKNHLNRTFLTLGFQPFLFLGYATQTWKNCPLKRNFISGWWFQRFFIFTPDPWGNWSNLTCAYFSIGLVQPSTRYEIKSRWVSESQPLRATRTAHPAISPPFLFFFSSKDFEVEVAAIRRQVGNSAKAAQLGACGLAFLGTSLMTAPTSKEDALVIYFMINDMMLNLEI